MTHLYNSKREPRKAYGADSPALEAFYQTFAEDAPGVEQLNQAIYRMRDPNATEYNWVLPDNFHAGYKVEDVSFYNVEFMGGEETIAVKTQQPNAQDRALGANTVHSIDGYIVREMVRRCDYVSDVYIQLTKMLEYSSWRDVEPPHKPDADDKMVLTLWNHYLKTNCLSARILNHLKPTNLYMVKRERIMQSLESMPKKPFKILTVFDCFRCHPNYGNDVRKQYNQILSELADSTVMDSILSQATGKEWFIPKFDDIASDIMNANYALS